MLNRQAIYQCLVILALSALIRAGGHFMRLALMMFMGLMGMYLMHKLAQDYQHWQRPAHAAGKLLGLWKRSIPDQEIEKLKLESQLPFVNENTFITFAEILDYDQSQCARRLVCQIGVMPHHTLNVHEKTIMNILRFKQENEAHTIFRTAAALGKITKDNQVCRNYFSKCKLTDEQMQRIMKFF
ncbi:uncharacterized protein LOC103504942 [Diaphorina citri]|uniref:Uncharacterized protein LOC103504942 n=1 Tax=Diaphorina citri TaxID=121845 RepID=A0A1S3CTH2_DIACI|nr:uncharacterized protein LOC103504942 [Diaphorina citri]